MLLHESSYFHSMIDWLQLHYLANLKAVQPYQLLQMATLINRLL